MNTVVLEKVLTEILDEQKQIADKLSSYTSIMMEMDEKLNNRDEEDNKNTELSERLKTIQLACQSIPKEITLSEDSVNTLNKTIQNEIHKSFHLHGQISNKNPYLKTLMVLLVGFILACFTLTYLYALESRNIADYHAENLKLRFLRMHSSAGIKKELYIIDSLYKTNSDLMENEVNHGQMIEKSQSDPVIRKIRK